MNICIVGLGLLGGSTALILRDQYPEVRIIGVDQSREHAAYALTYGMVDKVLPLDLGVPQADLVVLAAPVNVNVQLLPSVLDRLSPRSAVVDVGSTKEAICQAADQHVRRARFVAAHPIAGTERSGPEAAFSELLPGKHLILCDTERSDSDARERVENVFHRRIGMPLRYMSAPDHDRHVAYVSHLSHISSFALAETVLAQERAELSFTMADSGFSAAARLAKSSPAIWNPIFSQNQANISEALGDYIKSLAQFKEVLDRHDELESYQWMQCANKVRHVLSGPLARED